jgi:diguanylate cyclase (GGDEF)-like protein
VSRARGAAADRSESGPLQGLAALYLRAVDRCMSERIRASGDELLRQARIVAGLTFVLTALGLESMAFFWWVLPPGAAHGMALGLSAGMLLTLAVPLALRRGSVALAANVLLSAGLIVLLVVFVLVGGIRAPLLHWIALLPMLAMLMGRRRTAWAWLGVGIAVLGVFTALGMSGVQLPNHLDLSGSRLWLQRMVDVTTWIAMLFSVAVLYERHRNDHAEMLAAKNTELLREVAQRRRAEERTHYLAYHDDLTKLPNREFFKERLVDGMAQARAHGRLVAVLFLDLDGFKEVNDTLGHGLGDLLLQHVARRLANCVRAADAVVRGREIGEGIVSRLGGDEFTVLLSHIRGHEEAAIVARRILSALERPFTLDGREIFITVSIGIALYPGDDEDMDELLRNADLAMYHAKERGKNNYQFFDERMNATVHERSVLANDLRRALARDEFFMRYQPILSRENGAIVGVEALVRWQHPERGLLLPMEFIGVAENTGLMVPLGLWILGEACRQWRAWRDAGAPPLRLSVNVSSVQLRDPDLPRALRDILDRFRIAPKNIELEMTENAVMDDELEATRALAELKALGVRIALDDYGTGYSSLSYVKRFPVDSVKIDRSFVGEVSEHAEARAITTAIIAMAHQLDLNVVAEGVETEAQERFLVQHGCNELQGFRFSRPVAPEEIGRLLATQAPPDETA